MKKNLTLSVNQEVIALSKKFSKEKGKSLSSIVEDSLKSLVENRKEEVKYSFKLKRLIGAVKLPLNFKEDAERRSYLENRNK
jgi:hypothetical protein